MAYPAALPHKRGWQKGLTAGSVLNGANKNNIAYQLGVHPTTVQRWVEKYEDTGSLDRREGSGRLTVSTPEQDAALINVLVNDPRSSMRHAIQDSEFPGCINTGRARARAANLQS